jgi:hypothetical protein
MLVWEIHFRLSKVSAPVSNVVDCIFQRWLQQCLAATRSSRTLLHPIKGGNLITFLLNLGGLVTQPVTEGLLYDL